LKEAQVALSYFENKGEEGSEMFGQVVGEGEERGKGKKKAKGGGLILASLTVDQGS